LKWKKWTKTKLNPVKHNVSKQTSRSVKVESMTEEKEEKEQNRKALSLIEANLHNLVDVYYDKHQQLCLAFTANVKKALYENYRYAVPCWNVSVGCTYRPKEDRFIIKYIDSDNNNDHPYYLKWKTAVDALHQVIDIKSRNLDRLAGVRAEEKRIADINNKFAHAFHEQRGIHLKPLLNNSDETITYNDMKELISVESWGLDYLDLNFKQCKRRIFYATDVYSMLLNDEPSPELERYVYSDMWFKRQGDRKPNKFADSVEYYYFWYLLAKFNVDLVVGGESPCKLDICTMAYSDAFSDLAVEDVRVKFSKT